MNMISRNFGNNKSGRAQHVTVEGFSVNSVPPHPYQVAYSKPWQAPHSVNIRPGRAARQPDTPATVQLQEMENF
jgi:hypothetical protein